MWPWGYPCSYRFRLSSFLYALDLSSVGEGIETPEQLDMLHALGISTGQGYLMARPLESDKWLKQLAADELKI